MQDSSSRTRVRVAPNVYRRQKKAGVDVYEVAFRDVDGRQRLRRLDARTERAALREARAVLATRDDGERIVAADLTLDELADRDYWPMLDGLARAGRRSQRGFDLYKDSWRLYVQPDLRSLRLSQIDVTNVSALLRSLRKRGYSESTIYGALLVLRALYRLALRRGLVARSPLDGLDSAELPKPRRGGAGRVLTEIELAAFCRHAPVYYRPAVTTLAYTGLRISEVLGLRWCDIDFVEGELHVRGQLSRATKDRPAKLVHTKTLASERTVPLWPAVEQTLIELLEAEQHAGRGRDSDLVFCSSSVYSARAWQRLATRPATRREGGRAGARHPVRPASKLLRDRRSTRRRSCCRRRADRALARGVGAVVRSLVRQEPA